MLTQLDGKTLKFLYFLILKWNAWLKIKIINTTKIIFVYLKLIPMVYGGVNVARETEEIPKT